MSILDRIRANGGEVVRDQWRIRLRRGRLTDAAIKWIGERRDELMREVWPSYDDWLERAAIREFDGGQARHEAETAAYEEIMKREAAKC
ncbi:hypothetical protein [Pseudooceanicola atlanticus]|uniref:Uncharacterized protein n=1 Tax=Pseudooceanicola atlanticus TaxID=1461694 RepID=A0A0A0EKF3_9RHOB|nr:hypothetical protein [Pseudooceanicola atlanticus]KGM50648.1 hypothetical protein ATO9_04010 [Pseudooceanicola atlanticus]